MTSRPIPEWRVRPARPDDVRAVASIEQDAFVTEAWEAVAIEAELLRADRVALVAEDGDEVLGFVAFIVVADVADLNRLAVGERSRRRGVASALLVAGLARLADQGVTRVLLEVSDANVPAITFYRQAGFRGIARRRRYYRDGTDALVLELSLGQA
ncbi:MAG: ribosomal protein S18-alanine N-acetyltransferase [Nocardioidaceae bacterium]